MKKSTQKSTQKSTLGLRVLLGLLGVMIIVLGINVGFGGMRTLGWQGSTEFITVANQADFAVQDSHVRFLGGTWLGFGLALLIGAFAFVHMRPILIALMGLGFIGGLARFSALDTDVLFGPAVGPSLAIELIIFPLLALWISKAR